MTNRRRVAWYGATILLSSALLMVLEILAGRLIAPYVGVSLYTWTSVIGVILAGLSLGNWLGGLWADRGGDEGAVGITLGVAGLASFTILLLLTVVAPLIQENGFSLLGASFLFVFSLFFLPAMLLGVVTPLLTTLALGLEERTGHVVGRMHALAALGSILGTFAAGYWLIQYFGTRAVVVGCGLALFGLALPFLVRTRSVLPIGLVIAAALISGLTYARQGFLNPCDEESQYFCIRVVDVPEDAPSGQARALVLDHLLHGINQESHPEILASPYVHLMDELVRNHFGGAAGQLRYFFAGGGAYTQPRAVRETAPDARITVAELDPRVTATATQRLWLHPEGMRVLHEDARMALARLDGERFDVVIGDVFHDIAIPYHLTTREYLQLVKSRLAPEGLYLLNVVDAYPDPLLLKAIVKTLQAEFRHVDIWLEHRPRGAERVTYVVSASDQKEPPKRIIAQHGYRRMWWKVTDHILGQGTPLAEIPELRDDYVPVERLVSRFFFSELGL